MISTTENLGGSPVDSSNRHMVGTQGDKVVIMALKVQDLKDAQPIPFALTNDDAVNLAAWLTVLADPDGKKIKQLLQEIKKQ